MSDFQPSNSWPLQTQAFGLGCFVTGLRPWRDGFHALRLTVPVREGVAVTARTGYWAASH